MQFDLRVDINAIKTAAKADIDAAAEQTRLNWITPGSGQAMVYQQKQTQATSFLAQYPDAIAAATAQNTDWPLLAAELSVTGATLFDVATIIKNTADQWISVAAQIESLRLRAKQTVDNATTVSAVNAATRISWPTP